MISEGDPNANVIGAKEQAAMEFRKQMSSIQEQHAALRKMGSSGAGGGMKEEPAWFNDNAEKLVSSLDHWGSGSSTEAEQLEKRHSHPLFGQGGRSRTMDEISDSSRKFEMTRGRSIDTADPISKSFSNAFDLDILPIGSNGQKQRPMSQDSAGTQTLNYGGNLRSTPLHHIFGLPTDIDWEPLKTPRNKSPPPSFPPPLPEVKRQRSYDHTYPPSSARRALWPPSPRQEQPIHHNLSSALANASAHSIQQSLRQLQLSQNQAPGYNGGLTYPGNMPFGHNPFGGNSGGYPLGMSGQYRNLTPGQMAAASGSPPLSPPHMLQYDPIAPYPGTIVDRADQYISQMKQNTVKLYAADHKKKARFISSGSVAHYHGHGDFLSWRGNRLAPECNTEVSVKVFLGGLPWDITDHELSETFGRYGAHRVEWPNKNTSEKAHGKGYAYVVFEDPASAKQLLIHCKENILQGEFREYYHVIQRRPTKHMQIIPWYCGDNAYPPQSVLSKSVMFDPRSLFGEQIPLEGERTWTAFLGALHGQMTAHLLYEILSEKFHGGIRTVNLDTDKNKYPIGSGRAIFYNEQSFKAAINAGFIDVTTPAYSKRIQVDPYLEEKNCCECNKVPGDFFCRSFDCFEYYCHGCFYDRHFGQHMSRNPRSDHIPICRNPDKTAGRYEGYDSSAYGFGSRYTV